MVRKSKRRAKPQRSSRRVRPQRRRRTAAQPPLVPFNRVLANTVIRGATQQTFSPDQMVVVDFTVKGVLASWKAMIACYKEVKIKRVDVWTTAVASTADRGMLATIVCPKDEIDTGLLFSDFSTTPGAMVRRIYQTTRGVYFPTEPSEKDWFPIGSSDKHLFVLCFMTTGTEKVTDSLNPTSGSPNNLKIVWDAHVQLRGRAKVNQASQEFTMIEALQIDDDHMDKRDH